VAHKRVPEKIRQQIKNTVLSWPHDHEEDGVSIKEPPYKPAFDHDYDVYRQMEAETLNQKPEN
jgi:hypothetical protein